MLPLISAAARMQLIICCLYLSGVGIKCGTAAVDDWCDASIQRTLLSAHLSCLISLHTS